VTNEVGRDTLTPYKAKTALDINASYILFCLSKQFFMVSKELIKLQGYKAHYVCEKIGIGILLDN